MNADTKILALWPEIAETSLNNATVQFYYYYKSGDAKSGWYLTADSSSKSYCMNNYPLNAGDGFFMVATSAHNKDATNKGVTLTYSGAVDSEDTPITVADGGALTGNMIPADCLLGSLTPVSAKLAQNKFSASNFYLTLYSTTGNQRKVKDDAKILALWPEIAETSLNNATVQFYYYYKSGDAKSGWYLTADSSGKSYCMNNYPLNAGDGFFMVATSAHDKDATHKGVTLTFKSPLQ